MPTLYGSQRMALASGSQNDEILLDFVRYKPTNLRSQLTFNPRLAFTGFRPELDTRCKGNLKKGEKPVHPKNASPTE